MNKKLLILGSDYGSLEIVKRAKKRGIYTIVTDTMDTSPTKEEADESWHISTTETELLVEKCKENDITAVLTGASDFNISQSRKLCKKLNIPVYCESDFAWEIATNKRKFKDLCKKLGAPVAEDYYLDDSLNEEYLDSIKYPVVVKPVDKSGNLGMSYCANKQDLINGYNNAKKVSSNSTIIVERELHGPEFAVNYVLADGDIKLHFFSSEHNEPGELENLYSVITTTSAHLKKYIEEVNDKVISVLKEAGCKEGVAWVETILDSDGHFYLLEMGYRYGGEVVNIGYGDVCGFDSINWMIDIACGIKHKKEDLPKELNYFEEKIAAAYLLFAKKDGVIENIKGISELNTLENVYPDFPKREGSRVRYHATMGVIRLSASNIDDLCDKISLINDLIKITDKNGDDMFIYYTDFNSLKDEYLLGRKEFEVL